MYTWVLQGQWGLGCEFIIAFLEGYFGCSDQLEVIYQINLQIDVGGALAVLPRLVHGWEQGVWQSIDTAKDGCLLDQRKTIRACLGWWN